MEKSTHKAEVVEIKLLPHPMADMLSVVHVHGYQVCCRTSDWKDGMKAAYIVPDTLVDTTRPEFKFLESECKEGQTWYRVKAKKLRGIPSFGMLIPVEDDAVVGDDYFDKLGLKHFEPATEISMAGDAETPPMGFVPTYDLDSIRRYQNKLVDGEEVVATEKVHGCLHEDSMITMYDGSSKKISNVQAGDKILSFNIETNKLEEDVVEATICRKPTHLLRWMRLDFDSGERLICTEDHLILTKHGYVEAANLSESEEILGW